ncbi:MAG: YeeE/YedE thiosulfate transporter family protein [Verrucomicrobiales bacterium]|nr:YeeE/YedE thiosulfate transporter family protein [Verrucomicrobiales bacterium]
MNESTEKHQRIRQLSLGLLFGIIFGFLLQKGGVGKYHVLMGQLLLEDFTVLKIMLTAILTGMIGVFWMNRRSWVELDIKPTRPVANAIGGLLFGMGFGLSAYCPGTNAAAIGQGNFDGFAVAAGMIIGSYLFAEAGNFFKSGFFDRGNMGKVTLIDLLKTTRRPTIALAAAALIIVLVVVERIGGR